MAMPTTSPPATSPAIPLREQAWLIFQAMDQSDDIVILLESDGGANTTDAVIVGVNGAFRRASGFSDDELIGRQAAELLPKGNDAETLMKAIRTGTPLRTELNCGRAGGGTFTLGLHLMPTPARTPGRVSFGVLGRDITAVLQARQMQDSIQRMLAKVFISIGEAVAIVNAAGLIVMTNPSVDRLLGYKPNGLVGRSSLDLVAAGSRAAMTENIRQQLEQGGEKVCSASLLRANGTELSARITSVLVTTDNVTQFRIVTLMQDAATAPAMRTEAAGKIQLVGLDDVRKAMGDRWPAVAARAMATAEAVIKRRCGPTDSYSRADDTSFVMCFGALNEQESSFRAAMIGREIHDRLVGQGEAPDNAYVRSVAAVVRFPDNGESGAPLHAVLLDGLEQQLEGLEQAARDTLRNATGGTSCDLEPVLGRVPRDVVATQVHLCNELERGLVSALAVLLPKEAKAFDMDGLLLGVAAQQAINTMVRGDTTPLLINLSFDVFLTRAATESYLAACNKIDPRVCARLILLMSALPKGLPATRLLECVNRLRPFCSGVGYNVDDLAALAQVDLSNSFNPIVALSTAALTGLPPEKVKAIIGTLHTRKVRILVRGVQSEKDAAAFRSVGVDMIAMQRVLT
jgi:PAS domain S-box-containing protein